MSDKIELNKQEFDKMIGDIGNKINNFDFMYGQALRLLIAEINDSVKAIRDKFDLIKKEESK